MLNILTRIISPEQLALYHADGLIYKTYNRMEINL